VDETGGGPGGPRGVLAKEAATLRIADLPYKVSPAKTIEALPTAMAAKKPP